MSEAIELVKAVLKEQLALGERAEALTADSPIVGAMPEFDSMAVVSVVSALEAALGETIADDEISAEMFETVGSLAAFVADKSA